MTATRSRQILPDCTRSTWQKTNRSREIEHHEEFMTVNRRYFLTGSLATAVASRISPASPNDTVRIACVGFHNRGKAHLAAYPKVPNAQIVALCDVDESVLA